jgi:SAM-dependent methyltransferase
MRCDACDSALSVGLEDWHFVCRTCGLEHSTLSPQINKLESIDEIERERALKPIRDHNFGVLLEWLNGRLRSHAQVNGKRKLLDVGCAHGWFLEKAAAHYDVLGLEPDGAIADRAKARNLSVRKGYFPEALDAEERFAVIVFNDVLEHIPDVRTVLKECAARLSDDGVVVINAPDRRGLFYRLSKLFAKAGRTGAFHRMWQVGFPSPHLYYFDTSSLNKIAAASGFTVIAERPLPSIVAKGLYERINYARNVPRLRSFVITIGILALIPFLKVFHSDITVWLLEKRNIKLP